MIYVFVFIVGMFFGLFFLGLMQINKNDKYKDEITYWKKSSKEWKSIFYSLDGDEEICKNCKMYSPNTRHGDYADIDTTDGRYRCLAPTLEAQEHKFDYMKPMAMCIHPGYFVEVGEEEK